MKKAIKKNKLDLEYHKYIQIFNSFYILLTTGVLGFIGSFIFLDEGNKLFIGFGISALVVIIGIISIKRINKKLELILNEINDL